MLSYLMKFFLIEWKRETGFRMNFIIKFFTKMAYLFSSILFFKIIFMSTESIGGWDENMVLTLIGTAGIILNLSESLFRRGSVEIFSLVYKGGMELLLTKPVDPILLLLLYKPDPANLITLFPSVGVVVYGMIGDIGELHISGILLYIFSIFLSLYINGMVNLLIGLIAFKFPKNSGIFWIYQDLSIVMNYPYRIFPYLLRYVLITLIPVLAISNFPVLVLHGEWIFFLYEVVLALSLTIILRLLLPFALRGYQGAGTFNF